MPGQIRLTSSAQRRRRGDDARGRDRHACDDASVRDRVNARHAHGRANARDRARHAYVRRPARSATSDGGCGSSFLPEQQHDRRAAAAGTAESARSDRESSCRHHFSKSTSSASTVSLLRNSAIRMPRPTAASATASVITKIAKICPFTFCQIVRERDQVDVHRVQDQLDGHQNDDDVAAGEHADRADQQQRGAQRQVMRGGNGSHAQILFFAITTEPTTATSSSTEAISNGSRYCENSTSAICSVLPSVAAGDARRRLRQSGTRSRLCA